MKKYLFLIALAIPMLFIGCSDDEDEKKADGGSSSSETIKVSLEVTDIVDNQATINVSLSQGSFHGAKLIEAMSNNDVTIDPTSDIRLVDFVKENGIDIDLPYSNTITGLRVDAEMFTAVIVYDAEGLAVDTAYSIWTVVGLPEGWSTDNSAGELEEDIW